MKNKPFHTAGSGRISTLELLQLTSRSCPPDVSPIKKFRVLVKEHPGELLAVIGFVFDRL
jgi:hypothetical protein